MTMNRYKERLSLKILLHSDFVFGFVISCIQFVDEIGWLFRSPVKRRKVCKLELINEKNAQEKIDFFFAKKIRIQFYANYYVLSKTLKKNFARYQCGVWKLKKKKKSEKKIFFFLENSK